MNNEKLNNYIKEKEKKVITDEEKEKINVIKELVKNNDCFFKLGFDTSIGILKFLEVPEGEIMDFYFSLVSPSEFKKLGINQYKLIDEIDSIRR